jgi:transposase
MFVKFEKRITKDGNTRTYVRVVEGYRDALGASRIRAVKNYGYLEDQTDPVTFIENIKKEIPTLESDCGRFIDLRISDATNTNDNEDYKTYNYGYKYLEYIYDQLHIDSFFDEYQSKLDVKLSYKFKDIFKYYCLERIIHPDSKRASHLNIDSYYLKNYNFSLDVSYRSLDYFSDVFSSFQTHLRKMVDTIVTSNIDRIYYDVTNYYCEIDREDDKDNLRHRGVSKEHRIDPIIGLGLFMDSNGLPMQVNVFNGNTSECLTLISGINELKQKYNETKIILVADKGLNSSNNIKQLRMQNDGYIFSQILKGKKGKRYQEQLFSPKDWVVVSDTYKYKLYTEELNGMKQNVLIYWSKESSDRDKFRRDEKVYKALHSLTNGAYSIQHGYEKYLKDMVLNKVTGTSYTKEQLKAYRDLDVDKILNDEQYDGYNCLITSELEYTQSDIRKYYHELWEIEQTFRITKTDLEFRPIYHYKKEHIEAHFLICYTSLLILRLLQYKLKQTGATVSAERIINLINKMNLDTPDKGVVHIHQIGKGQIWEDYKLLNKTFNVSYNRAFDKVEVFKKHLKSLTFTQQNKKRNTK